MRTLDFRCKNVLFNYKCLKECSLQATHTIDLTFWLVHSKVLHYYRLHVFP